MQKAFDIFIKKLEMNGFDYVSDTTKKKEEEERIVIEYLADRIKNKIGYYLSTKDLFKKGEISEEFFEVEKKRLNREIRDLFSKLNELSEKINEPDDFVLKKMDEMIKNGLEYRLEARKFVMEHYIKFWKKIKNE